MRLSKSQSDSSNISRYKRPKPILPELKNYLAEQSILQNSFRSKKPSYDMSFIMPKQINIIKIQDTSDKEFKPFLNERDKLGRLLSKGKNQNLVTITNPNESDNVFKQMRSNYLDTSNFKTQRSIGDQTSRKKGSLQLNSVAMMHLNDFYQQTQESRRKSSRDFQNYQQDVLVEDQETDNILEIKSNEFINISQIIPKDITQTKLSIERDLTNQNSTPIKQQQPMFKQMKSKFEQLKEFSILYCHQDNLTQDDNNFMQEIAKMYTQPKRKIQLCRKKGSLPSIGQYDIVKCDSVRFKKSPNPIISREGSQVEKKEIKDVLEQYMQEVRSRKRKHSQSVKRIQKIDIIPKTNRDENDETSLPPLRIRNVKVVNDKQFDDEGKLFDQMNSEFYKYPQEFSDKLKWAQKKVLKIQNDLRTWDERQKRSTQQLIYMMDVKQQMIQSRQYQMQKYEICKDYINFETKEIMIVQIK